MKVVRGDRAAALGDVKVGTVAAVFDGAGRLLLTERQDNGSWCLPGGRVDAGESVRESCVRELREETGLDGEVAGLIAIHSDPHLLVEYADGERLHSVSLLFLVTVGDTELSLNRTEVSAARWVAEPDLDGLRMTELDEDRIRDCFAPRDGWPLIR